MFGKGHQIWGKLAQEQAKNNLGVENTPSVLHRVKLNDISHFRVQITEILSVGFQTIIYRQIFDI